MYRGDSLEGMAAGSEMELGLQRGSCKAAVRGHDVTHLSQLGSFSGPRKEGRPSPDSDSVKEVFLRVAF